MRVVSEEAVNAVQADQDLQRVGDAARIFCRLCSLHHTARAARQSPAWTRNLLTSAGRCVPSDACTPVVSSNEARILSRSFLAALSSDWCDADDARAVRAALVLSVQRVCEHVRAVNPATVRMFTRVRRATCVTPAPPRGHRRLAVATCSNPPPRLKLPSCASSAHAAWCRRPRSPAAQRLRCHERHHMPPGHQPLASKQASHQRCTTT
jgi:hypothetical protein